jgi:hypothetical protein
MFEKLKNLKHVREAIFSTDRFENDLKEASKHDRPLTS